MNELETRYSNHPEDVKHYGSEKLRKEFLIPDLMQAGKLKGVYSHYDRMIILGIAPLSSSLTLPAFESHTKQPFFLSRREMGVINIGGTGSVTVDGKTFELNNKDCLYVGMGKKEIKFESHSETDPALFYVNSCPANKEFSTAKAAKKDANPVAMGAQATANERTIYQYIHLKGIQSCQLVMGLTELKPGNIWNTFPPHVHDRRMEVYFYFDMNKDQKVCHFMGQPEETRHVFVKNHEAVISPPWSIHAGAGTGNYSFIWSMAGENIEFTDMDAVNMDVLR
jgi:4-deoxy-L-threo-5-hexosulose-uronate ketol-isomerase